MSDDLVKRLRSYAKDQGGWHNIDDTCEEAADRIEKLEQALKEQSSVSDRLAEQLEQLVAINEAARADAKEAEAYAEELEKERERLALAICGGEDAPGYANAQTVETLEKVARDNANATMEQINLTLDVEAKLSRAVDVLSECLERNALLEAKLAECEARLGKAVEGLRGFMSKVDTACLVERDHPQVEFADAWRDAYAIIAEIEGEQP
jgi:DNA repair exonuclease SbcCD ATPase subunit